MGFLDNLRDRFSGRDDYYDDDYYDDGDGQEYDDEPVERSGILGNTRRREAESVSVRTRSGRPVTNSYGVGGGSGAYGSGAYGTGSERGEYTDTGASIPTPRGSSYGVTSHATYTGNGALGTAGTLTPGDVGVQPIPRTSSGQLPAYVLRPTSYDDVQTVVRRVKTNQPVVLAFGATNIEIAKRILDFSFGLSCGIGGTVEELGDKAFVVLPAGSTLTQVDRDKLVADGIVGR